MSRNQKALGLLAVAVVGQVVAGRVMRQQAAVLGIPMIALSVLGLVASGAFA
ncbi:hypothetical protein [Streptomyces sp. NPDC006551]|uniref:hypothetical protein n=1 Tax=Streptomyces sp. NPDC006551 TaxID=3157178 RepID=UPI0033AF59B5